METDNIVSGCEFFKLMILLTIAMAIMLGMGDIEFLIFKHSLYLTLLLRLLHACLSKVCY